MNTNFHFDIESEYFPEALQKFSSFFTDTCLDSSSDPNILKKVDDLFKMYKDNDAWRFFSLI